MARIVLRVALVVFGCALAFGLIELALRAHESYVSVANGVSRNANNLYMLTNAPHRYELRPRVRGYRGRIDINALGLRGPEIPEVPEPNEFRVLFVGDSIT